MYFLYRDAMGLPLETPRDLLDVYEAINIMSYIMSSMTVIVNGGILLAYCIQKIRKPTYQLTPAGYLVMNLLVADCLCGVVCTYVVQFKMWPENARAMAKYRYICPIRFAGGFLGFIGSHFALLCIVIDRYIAVLKTMQYREWMTSAMSFKMIIGGWIIPVCGAIIIVTKNGWFEGVETCTENTIIPTFLFFVWIPMTVIVLMMIVLIQAKVHFELSRRSKSDSPLAIVLRRVTRKSARVLLQSTTIFIICWGYFDGSLLIYLFVPHKWTKLIYDISFPVALSSFLSNPMLYSYKTKSINEPVRDLLLELQKVLLCKKVDDSSPPSIVSRDSPPNRSPKGPEKRLSLSGQTFVTSLDYNVV